MTTDKLKQVLELHAKWSRGEAGGTRANLRGAYLRGANLIDANLRGADLSDTDLRGANLSGAYLIDAYLSGANLRDTDLSDTDLRGANLRGANLKGANLIDAYLIDANLRGADLRDTDLSDAQDVQYVLAQSSILPETGPIWGWKKCREGVLVKLVVGNTAKRSHGTGRKCRAEHVKVLEVIGAEVGLSIFDDDGKQKPVEYRVGQIVRCDKWNKDRWTDCGGGIHFFLSRIEAERYG